MLTARSLIGRLAAAQPGLAERLRSIESKYARHINDAIEKAYEGHEFALGRGKTERGVFPLPGTVVRLPSGKRRYLVVCWSIAPQYIVVYAAAMTGPDRGSKPNISTDGWGTDDDQTIIMDERGRGRVMSRLMHCGMTARDHSHLYDSLDKARAAAIDASSEVLGGSVPMPLRRTIPINSRLGRAILTEDHGPVQVYDYHDMVNNPNSTISGKQYVRSMARETLKPTISRDSKDPNTFTVRIHSNNWYTVTLPAERVAELEPGKPKKPSAKKLSSKRAQYDGGGVLRFTKIKKEWWITGPPAMLVPGEVTVMTARKGERKVTIGEPVELHGKIVAPIIATAPRSAAAGRGRKRAEERDATRGKASARSDRGPKDYTKQIAKLRNQAAKMIEKADEELSRERLENTPRRARMAEHARKGARARKQAAQNLVKIADAIESGDHRLAMIKTRGDQDRLIGIVARQPSLRREEDTSSASSLQIAAERGVWPKPTIYDSHKFGRLRDWVKEPHGEVLAKLGRFDKYEVGPHDLPKVKGALTALRRALKDKAKRTKGASYDDYLYDTERALENLSDAAWLLSIGVASDKGIRRLFSDYADIASAKRERETEQQRLRRELVGVKIRGFHSTPDDVADLLVKRMGPLPPNATVLEPSAGTGALVEAVMRAHPTATVVAIEPMDILRRVLTSKGIQLVGIDALLHHKKYDAVVANPPFHDALDRKHVRHYFDHNLKPGGVLGAIVSGSALTNDSAQAFRDWVEEHGGKMEKLPSGSFMKSDQPTPAETAMVVMRKPGGGERMKPKSPTPAHDRPRRGVRKAVKSYLHDVDMSIKVRRDGDTVIAEAPLKLHRSSSREALTKRAKEATLAAHIGAPVLSTREGPEGTIRVLSGRVVSPQKMREVELALVGSHAFDALRREGRSSRPVEDAIDLALQHFTIGDLIRNPNHVLNYVMDR